MAVPATTSCGGAPSSESQAAAPHPSAGTSARASRTHLQIDGVAFRTPDGQPFQWRGITAFRLLDYVADKNEAEAETFLAWAQAQKLTVVRVLAMGGGFMDLKPAEGRSALSRLLSLAAKHGLYVEVVALAGTMETPVNLDEQLSALGETLGDHANALLEVANEPTHPSQAPRRRQAGGPARARRSRAGGRARRARIDRGGRELRPRRLRHLARTARQQARWLGARARRRAGRRVRAQVEPSDRQRRADRRGTHLRTGTARRCAGAVSRGRDADPAGRARRDVPLRGRPAGEGSAGPRARVLQRLERGVDAAAGRRRITGRLRRVGCPEHGRAGLRPEGGPRGVRADSGESGLGAGRGAWRSGAEAG